jgi:hypothetical protein
MQAKRPITLIPVDLAIQFLTPKELISLALTSQGVFEWCNLLENAYWRECLAKQHGPLPRPPMLDAPPATGALPTDTVEMFFTQPQIRLPLYRFFGELGQQYLRNVLSNGVLHTKKIAQYSRILLKSDVGADDIKPVTQLLDLEAVPQQQISNWLKQGKTIDEIKKKIGVASLKQTYHLTAKIYFRQFFTSAIFFMLAIMHYYITVSDRERLASSFFNEHPGMPPHKTFTKSDSASILAWSDYCSGENSDDAYCDHMPDSSYYGTAIYHELFLSKFLMPLLIIGGGFNFLDLTYAVANLYFSARPYIKLSILNHYTLPKVIANFLNPSLTNEGPQERPRIIADAIPLMTHNALEKRYDYLAILYWVIIPQVVLALTSMMFILEVDDLRRQGNSEIANGLCHAPINNQYLASSKPDHFGASWPECQDGTLTVNDEYALTESDAEFCQQLCKIFYTSLTRYSLLGESWVNEASLIFWVALLLPSAGIGKRFRNYMGCETQFSKVTCQGSNCS